MSENRAAREPYTKRLTRRSPKLVVFAIDESHSMHQMAGGRRKSAWMQDELNKQIRQLIGACMKMRGDEVVVRPYLRLAAVGYGGTDRNRPELHNLLPSHADSDWIVPVEHLYDLAKKAERSNGGDKVEFVQVRDDGWTPTANAIKHSGWLIREWLRARAVAEGCELHQLELPAPTIIHTTDGQPTDDDTPNGPVDKWVDELPGLATADGPPLLINIGISDGPHSPQPCCFPTIEELPDDPYMRRLWDLSSPLPSALLRRALRFDLLPAGSTAEGRRLYAHFDPNSDLSSIFEFGTMDKDPR